MIIFKREVKETGTSPGELFMTIISFFATNQDVWLSFPEKGHWSEQIDKGETNARPDINVINNHDWHKLTVPSYYGFIYLKT